MSTDTVEETEVEETEVAERDKPLHPHLETEGGKITEVVTAEDRAKYQRLKKTDFATELLHWESMILYYKHQRAAVDSRIGHAEQQITEIKTYGDAEARQLINDLKKLEDKKLELEAALKKNNPKVNYEKVGIRKLAEPTKKTTKSRGA